MAVRRRARVVAAGGGLALAGSLGVGAVVAPRASSAPRPTALAPARSVAPSDAPAPVAGSVAAPVLASVTATPGYLGSRLVLTVQPGRTLTVIGVLTRASDGSAVQNRPVLVYTRTGDTGGWQLAATLQTSSRGRVQYRVRDAANLQITLRFSGDRRFRPAASVLIAPHPTATALDPGIVRALARAATAARRAGLPLVVNSGWRSWAKQQRMFDAAVRQYGSPRVARRWVLPPQESTHVRGLAADIGTPATAAWLGRHGAAFGLCRAYGDEAWHFEYRPDWVRAFHGHCPPPVPLPGDPDPTSPAPHVPVMF